MEILLLKLNLYQILKQFISKIGKLTSKYIIILENYLKKFYIFENK